MDPNLIIDFKAALQQTPLDLASAALAIAAIEFPGVTAAPHLARLDALAREAEPRISGLDTADAASTLSRLLFDEMAFTGNEDEYYDPRNSCLNYVIEERLGIPITLSLLLIEVGRRAGIPIEGVGFPGHFIARVRDEERMRFFDPFAHGREVSVEELAARINLAPDDPRLEPHLAAVTPKQILNRMLANLKFTYLDRGQFAQAHLAMELLIALSPWALEQIKDRGLIAYRLGRYDQAHQDLVTYAEYRPDADDAGWVRRFAEVVRQLAHDQTAL